MENRILESRTHRGWSKYFAPASVGWAGPLTLFCLGLTLSLLLCIHFQRGGPEFIEACALVVQIVFYAANFLLAWRVARQALAIRESIGNQELLRELQERFQGIYHSSQEAIVFSSPEGRLRDVNDAEEAGKAQHLFFTGEMRDRATRRLELGHELRPAIENGEICLFYQPIVEIRTGRIAGFEALARWRHPKRGLISPAEFVPIAEQTGLIAPLGAYVLREAARQLRRWRDEFAGRRELTMSVNLSSRQFIRNDLDAAVASAIRDAQIAPGCLHLEVTESILLRDRATAVDVMQRLRKLGVRLSIDDFGAGYPSLSCLHQLPVDRLKIDRSFVSGLADESDNFEIVRSILTRAHAVGIEVIAEGIENDRELDLLRALECRYGQGYHFFRPAPAAAVAGLLGPTGTEARPGGEGYSLGIYGPLAV